MKIGLLGGTFDPPHLGHMILASEAQDQLCLDNVYWILTPYPPHKGEQKISPLAHRQKMVELAIEDNPRFVFSRVDIDRPPPQYAVDTVNQLRQQSPGDEFNYLLGLDSLNDLTDWHDPQGFVRSCGHIVVMMRQGEEFDLPQLEVKIPGINEKLLFLKTPTIEISGSDIRQRAAKGISFRYFVPDKVYQYILKNKLYRD